MDVRASSLELARTIIGPRYRADRRSRDACLPPAPDDLDIPPSTAEVPQMQVEQEVSPCTTDGRVRPHAPARSEAVLLLQIFSVALMIVPSSIVLKAVGGGGYVAALIAYVLFLAWVATTLFGIHNPLDYRSPPRIALAMFWIVALISYALMNRSMLSTVQLTGADRWLLQLAGVSGVILVSAEFLRSVTEIQQILRALTWGGAVCGIVAALQFWLSLDLTQYIKIPGFSLNLADTYINISSRGGLNRVVGTAVDPIELGVVSGMLLPLAIYLAMHDVDRPAWRRWLPTACIAIAIPASVSRSAVLSAGIATGIFILLLPAARRLPLMSFIPVAVAAVFVTAHHLIGTLVKFFSAGTTDPSISHRVNNYSLVEQLVHAAPWFGQGGGTYHPITLHILDNQYLTSAIEIGLIGLAALFFFFTWPVAAALVARKRTTDPALRDLAAALAGAELAATACSATFDCLSFPMFVYVQALVIGLIGACWVIVNRSSSDDRLDQTRATIPDIGPELV
jgi:O-Antigen ligase